MRRTLLLCVLLGVVTTVVVAWAIAVRVDMSRAPVAAFSAPFAGWDGAGQGMLWNGHTGWRVLVLGRPGSKRVIATAAGHDTGYRLTLPFDSRVPRGVRRTLAMAEDAGSVSGESPGWLVWDERGWPLPALACEWPWWRWRGGRFPPVAGGVALPSQPIWNGFRQGALRALPLTPRWGGLAVDTLVTARHGGRC